MENRGPRGREALAALADALPGASVGEPDAEGIFEVELAAPSFDDALHSVFDGVASAGADDAVVFVEHPGIPEHWQRR